MMLFIFFCFPLAVIRGQSPPPVVYDQRRYETESQAGRNKENSNPHDQYSKYFDSGLKEEAEDGEERPAQSHGIVDREVADQLEGNGWLDVIPGIPGKDYPNYERIPETSFTCEDKTPGGYYADIEARCQVFHVCNTGGQKSSFVCPSGSIFNQKYFVCDWWYDFECDDATDLYSLNEKVNRGGTGSGPSGPGRIEQTVDYPSDNQDFHEGELRNGAGNFVVDRGYDLSLAGTGEGGPGYSRNGNSKGYQSNVDDENDEERKNGGNQGHGQGSRRKNFTSRKVVETRKVEEERNFRSGNKKQERSDESLVRESSSGFGKDRIQEFDASSDTSAGRNSRVNYNPGYVNPNSNGPLKTNNFRTGHGSNDRAQQSNEFNVYRNGQREFPASNTANSENNDNNYPRRDGQSNGDPEKDQNRNLGQNGFGERSSIEERHSYIRNKNTGDDNRQGSPSSGLNNKDLSRTDKTEEGQSENSNAEAYDEHKLNSDKNYSPSSGPNNNEYRIPSAIREGTRPTNVRGRQRTSGGLPGGLGNGYPSPGRTRELPGSDAIASTITSTGRVYDEGDRRSLNSQQKTSSGTRNPGEVTDLRSATDTQRISPLDVHNQQNTHRSDFRQDNYFTTDNIDSHNSQASKNTRKYVPPNSSSRNESYQERNSRVVDQRHQNSGNNYGTDYLVGIVPGVEDRGNGTSVSNLPRRFLPIL